MKYHRHAFKQRLMAGEVPKWLLAHKRRNYIISAVLSYPLWITSEELAPIYAHRDALTKQTGIEHHIDHIVPLRHPLVCGLSVPWNMEVIPAHANLRKGGKWSSVEQYQYEMQL